MHAPSRDVDCLPWGDSRNTPRCMSALEKNPQFPAPTAHKVLGPGIEGKGIPRGPRETRFLSRGSRDQGLSFVAFPRGFHTRLSHVSPWCESILGLNFEAVQGKQVSLEWTETSGGLWEWWHDPRVPLDFPVESASSLDVTGMPGILSRPRRERIPPLDLGGGNGAPLDVGGTLVLPLEWRQYVRELPELQQGCEGPFGSSRG